MVSLDVNSLLPTFLLMKLLTFASISFLKTLILFEGFAKVLQPLCLATKESNFRFNGLLYKQIDCIAICRPLGPSLANAFLSYHEKRWLDNFLQGFEPVFSDVMSMIF